MAAALVAVLVAMMSGFIAKKVVHPDALEKDAVEIEGAAVAGGGAVAKPILPDPVLHLIATADIARGQKLSKACAACHSFDKDGPSKVGPNLWGVTLGPKAAKGGFSYSETLKTMEGAWSYERLNSFLWKPKKYAPGTKMNYIGLKKPEDRAALIAWLRTLSDSKPTLPNASEIAAEAAAFAGPDAAADSDVPAENAAH